MAYSSDENAGGLDILTTLATGDLHIVGDISDANRAKVISENNLEVVIANSTNFVDELVQNAYFTTTLAGDSNFQSVLAGDSNFVTLLTSDTLFQTLVNNFAGGGGSGGGGGTKLAIDTTASSYSGGVGGTAYTIPIPGGTLGTNNAIRFKVLLSSVITDTGLGFIVKYGGTTLGQMAFTSNASSDGAILFGEIIADGATNAQKFIGTVLGLVDGTGGVESDTQYDGASVEDSTVSQDLEIEVNPSGTSSVTVQAIIVEKIASGSESISMIPQPAFFSTDASLSTNPNANTEAHVGKLVIPSTITVSNITISVTTVTVAGTLKIALFSDDGLNKLFEVTTANISGTGNVSTAVTPTTIAPGTYYLMVMSVVNATDVSWRYYKYNTALDSLNDPATFPIISGLLSGLTAGTIPTTFDPTTMTALSSGLVINRLDA